jgi:3-oxoacyl-[acyl-carrier protein] reductase
MIEPEAIRAKPVLQDLAGQVALITAAAGAGIGQAIALEFAEAGATVVVTDHAAHRAEQVASAITAKTGATVIPIELDVTDEERIAEVVTRTQDEFGRVDILVNNAGIVRRAPLWEMSTETWRNVQDICLTSQFWTMRAVLPDMVARRAGSIVNIASVYGWMGSTLGEANYMSAKAGVMGLTRAVASEVGQYGIRVNAIAPGLIFNEFVNKHYGPEYFANIVDNTPLGRPGRPSEIATVAHFLAVEASSFITGEVISVSGGWYMHA